MSSIDRWSDTISASTPSFGGRRDPLARAMQGGIGRFVEASREASASQSVFVQAADGAGTALLSIAAAIPAGLTSWFEQTAREVPHGPGATAYRFFEVPIRGMIEGTAQLFDTAKGWARGDLSGKDSFAIAFEVTQTLGILPLLFLGVRGIAGGFGKLASGAGEAGGVIISGGGLLAMWSAVQVSLAGVADIAGGAIFLCAAGETGNAKPKAKGKHDPKPHERDALAGKSDEEILAVLERNGFNRTAAAEELGVAERQLDRRLVRMKEAQGEKAAIPNKLASPKMDPMEVYETLKRLSWDRTAAKAKLNISTSTFARSIRELKRRGIQIPPSSRPPMPSPAPKGWAPYQAKHKKDQPLAVALHKYLGDPKQAGAEVGMSAREVIREIMHAKKGSPLEHFKPRRLSQAEVVRTLERTDVDGDWAKAAEILNVPVRYLDDMIRDARKGSKLHRYKPVVVSNQRLFMVLEKLSRRYPDLSLHALFRKAEEKLGLPPDEVRRQVLIAPVESDLFAYTRKGLDEAKKLRIRLARARRDAERR